MTVQKRQLPLITVIIANFKNRVGARGGGDFSSCGGRCKEDRVYI